MILRSFDLFWDLLGALVRRGIFGEKFAGILLSFDAFFMLGKFWSADSGVEITRDERCLIVSYEIIGQFAHFYF